MGDAYSMREKGTDIYIYTSKAVTLPPSWREGGEEYGFLFLTSALDGSEWSASALAALHPLGNTPGTDWIIG
jgi:hypothetical protein